MNKLVGKLAALQVAGGIVLADIDACGQRFSALMIESGELPHWMVVGASVALLFKETEVSLAKKLSGQLSIRNRMDCNVERIVRGQLLTTVYLRYQGAVIASAITTRAADALQITLGEDVTALVKSSEMTLGEEK
ncbi:MAG: TOBE domain-containing protein [Breznakibacter sp.]